MVMNDTERRCVPILLLGDHYAVMDIHPARDGGGDVQRTRPLEQCRMALACAVRVTELDVVAGNQSERVEVPLVEGVMPGEDGRDLRSRHGREGTPQNAVRSSQRPQTASSPNISTPSSATVRRRLIANRRSVADPRSATPLFPCSCDHHTPSSSWTMVHSPVGPSPSSVACRC